MKIFKILYFYYFSFYRKVDDEPHAMTVFALSFSESLLLEFIIQVIFAHYYCYFFSTWQLVSMGVVLLIINYFIFIKSGISKKIVRSSPPFVINQRFTKAFVILFFIITVSFLFWGPILMKAMFEGCK